MCGAQDSEVTRNNEATAVCQIRSLCSTWEPKAVFSVVSPDNAGQTDDSFDIGFGGLALGLSVFEHSLRPSPKLLVPEL